MTVIPIAFRPEDAWKAWLKAKKRAERTGLPEDWRAAEDAWDAFIDLQIPRHLRETSKYARALMRQMK